MFPRGKIRASLSAHNFKKKRKRPERAREKSTCDSKVLIEAKFLKLRRVLEAPRGGIKVNTDMLAVFLGRKGQRTVSSSGVRKTVRGKHVRCICSGNALFFCMFLAVVIVWKGLTCFASTKVAGRNVG